MLRISVARICYAVKDSLLCYHLSSLMCSPLLWNICFLFTVLPCRFCDFFCLYPVCCNSNFLSNVSVLRLIIGLCFRYIIDGDEPTLSKPPLWKWVLRIIMLLLQFAPLLRFLTSKT